MSFSEDIGVTGRVGIEVRDPTGQLVETRQVKNLVTIEGRRLLGRCLAGETGLTGMLHMAVGKGKSPPMLVNDKLDDETARVLTHTPAVSIENDRVVLRVNATFERLVGNAVE